MTVAEAVAAIGLTTGDDQTWPQRLYPVVDGDGLLTGVVTRGALLGAEREDPTTMLSEVMAGDPVLTHADQPLRHVAELMAINEINRLPGVDRQEQRRVVGMVSLTQLLTGRQRDQLEARERERVLRVRLVRPRWTPQDDATTPH